LVLAVLAGLVAAVVGGVAIVAASRGGAPAQRASVQTPGPVVLVPGYGGGTDALQVLAATLRAAGRDARVMPLPGDGRGDLTEQAKALALEVADVRRQTGAASVDVIGYSAGGVVARLWVRDYGGARVARRVVTLGSPHHGTNLAGLAGVLLPDACPIACQQLEPDSSLLAGLNAGDETPSGPQFVSIWTTTDDVVIPPESAVLAGAVDVSVQSVCASSRVGHGDLPSDREVEAMVVRELGAEPPASLTAADCARL
jgi:triacylglycerol esterase/lipase EstA (alpha/beta hydrolase family)